MTVAVSSCGGTVPVALPAGRGMTVTTALTFAQQHATEATETNATVHARGGRGGRYKRHYPWHAPQARRKINRFVLDTHVYTPELGHKPIYPPRHPTITRPRRTTSGPLPDHFGGCRDYSQSAHL
jgi:hypothetical protein